MARSRKIKSRAKMKRTSFALPGKKSAPVGSKARRNRYPIDTLGRARNALARVSAHGTPAEKRKVARAVRRKYPGLAKRSTFIKRVLK